MLSGFEHHGVACRQGGRQFPGAHQNREVPRNDLSHHTEWFVEVVGHRVLVDLRQRALLGADRRGEVPEVIGSQRNIGGQRLAHRFAVVPHFGHRQRLLVFLNAVGDLVQDRRPLGRRCLAPRSRCAVRGVERLVDVGLIGAGHFAECLSGHRRRVLEVAGLGRSNPFPPDEVLVAGFIRHHRSGGTRTRKHGHLLDSSLDHAIRLTLRPGATMASMTNAAQSSADPYLWLEEVTGTEALDWVRSRIEPTMATFCDAEFEKMRAEALEVLDTDTRIPDVFRRGEYLYNFWRDADNPRGLWRRTTLDSYRTDDPDWDVLIDVDALGRTDNQKWVWAGANVIKPERTRALVTLSPGGSDAAVVREFDMQTREFVVDGFELAEAKSDITWADSDTVLVGTDFGEGSLTDSGYPRIVKRWHRDALLADAQTLFEGASGDVQVFASVDRTPGFEATLLVRGIDFWNNDVYELRDGELIHIDVPTDAGTSLHRGWLLIRPRPDCSRGALAAPWLAADQPAHRLVARHHLLHRRLATGRPLRRIPFRHGRTDGGVRARRAHCAASGQLDARPAAAGHPGRRGQPGTDRHTRHLAARRAVRHSRGNQHHHHRHRRHRRRILPDVQWVRHTTAAVARHRRRTAGADQIVAGFLRRRKPLCRTVFRYFGRRNADPLLRGAAKERHWAGPDSAGSLRRLRGVQHTGLRGRSG